MKIDRYVEIGNSPTQTHRENIARKTSKKWKLYSPYSNMYYVENLAKWIRDNELDLCQVALHGVAYGKYQHHKWWWCKLVDEIPEGQEINKKISEEDRIYVKRTYHITDKLIGHTIVVTNMTEFTKGDTKLGNKLISIASNPVNNARKQSKLRERFDIKIVPVETRI
jgi:hypothetical protein